MATAHLISGLPCSGKSTYAIALKADANSILFSLDRWLITSFGKYSIASVGHEEHTRRVLACRELIWGNAKLPRYNFYIDPETLQGFLGLFERPSEQEGAELVVVQNVAQPGSTGANASKHDGA
jgi:hypothetical protein